MSQQARELITQHLDLWTSAITSKKTTGRGSSKKIELYGVKKLRELILELAVRGKLVPQDPNDEPTSELIKRIAEEKVRLVDEGKIKKSKSLPPVSEGEKPFDIPLGWEWKRLNDVYDVRDGTHDSPKYTVNGFPLITSKNLFSGTLDFSDVKNISEIDYKKISERSNVDHLDILFAMIGSIGNAVIVDTDRKFAIKNVALFKYYSGELSCPEFLLKYLKYAEAVFKANSSGAVQSFVSLGKIRSFPVALPPLQEQRRIVAKVDELMALCDQLENQTEQNLNAHATLADTLLDALTTAQSGAELMENWQRLEQHWDILFPSTIAGLRSIDKLKQTILQLAVMGKLVPQDPSDEPASELLKRIAAEKEQLVKDKKIKKQKPLPPITDEEKPFELPEGWEWARLGCLGFGATGKTPSSKKPGCFGGKVPFIGPGQITPEGKLLDSDKYLTEKGVEYSTLALPDDLMMVCIGGSIGKSVIADRRVTFNQQINALSAVLMDIKYLFYSVCTNGFQSQLIERSTGSATPIINRGKWEELFIPLPHLEEQKRIVAKVEELTSLCDQLKQRLQAAQQTQQHFTDSVAESALVPSRKLTPE